MQAELPTAEEAREWVGFRLDDLGGASVGNVTAVFCDTDSGGPAWVVAKLGRFGKTVAIPFRDCAAGAGHIWVPYGRDELRAAPVVDALKPLTREQELAVAAHYGISERVGRGAEVAGRPEGEVTAEAVDAADG
jgi:hypothetical protein